MNASEESEMKLNKTETALLEKAKAGIDNENSNGWVAYDGIREGNAARSLEDKGLVDRINESYWVRSGNGRVAKLVVGGWIKIS